MPSSMPRPTFPLLLGGALVLQRNLKTLVCYSSFISNSALANNTSFLEALEITNNPFLSSQIDQVCLDR